MFASWVQLTACGIGSIITVLRIHMNESIKLFFWYMLDICVPWVRDLVVSGNGRCTLR